MESFKSRKVLIITSSGGGGLLQAATAKEQEIKCKDPFAEIVHRDVMKDWIWKWLGNFCVGLWNRAQIKGCVRAQSFLGGLSYIAHYFFWPHIFFWALYTLFKEDIDQVIDTQVMGTSAIIKALRFFNRCRKKRLYLEKVLVDLPTKKATHFFSAIKSLSKKDRKYFKLITIAPMLEKNQTEEEFWKENCNLTKTELQYEDYYVRQAFIKYRNMERKKESMVLKTRFRNMEEWELIKKTIVKGTPQLQKKEGEVEFLIPSKTLVCTILLGSQPASDATLNYVKKFVEIARNKDSQEIGIHLFVFCSNNNPQQPGLFKKVADYISNLFDYPQALTVIPMSFQSDDVIAPLFFRSDITCTRSGGQTAMELMSASRGKIWVHSEAKKEGGVLTNEELLNGIPGWESANASYLQHVKNAKIVTPETFEPLVYELILENKDN